MNAKLNRIAARWLTGMALALMTLPAWAAPQTVEAAQPAPAVQSDPGPATPTSSRQIAWDRVGAPLRSVA